MQREEGESELITFRLVQPEADRATIVTFYADISEEEAAQGGFHFDEAEYLEFAKQKAADLPEGFVFMERDGETIGELVLRKAEYEGREVGYISFIYLIQAARGKGYSEQMIDYAERLFTKLNLTEYHLRVAQANARAIRFYEKHGFYILGEEQNSISQACWRMGKRIARLGRGA
ncbi:GNAT family N-acetyltransferase [Tumebacillus algifaecis]|nr:GNAT family N-acetyltransferase [Tumebacillus algifaecis]